MTNVELYKTDWNKRKKWKYEEIESEKYQIDKKFQMNL